MISELKLNYSFKLMCFIFVFPIIEGNENNWVNNELKKLPRINENWKIHENEHYNKKREYLKSEESNNLLEQDEYFVGSTATELYALPEPIGCPCYKTNITKSKYKQCKDGDKITKHHKHKKRHTKRNFVTMNKKQGKHKNKYYEAIKNIFDKDNGDDGGFALLNYLTDSNNRLSDNYKVIYNENNEPIIVYDGELEKDLNFNSTKNRNLQRQKYKQLSDFSYYNAADKNKRFIHFLKTVTEGVQRMNPKHNHTSGPFHKKYDVLKWKQTANNLDDVNKQNLINLQTDIPNSLIKVSSRNRDISYDLDEQTTELVFIRTPIMNHISLTTDSSIISNISSAIIPQLSESLPGIQNFIDKSVITNYKKGYDSDPGCHPSGGPPKVVKSQLSPDIRDKQYADVLSGELTLKVVQKILDKTLNNEKMTVDFGFCRKNLSLFKVHFINVTKSCKSCTHLYGELKCFLNWLLSIDLNRKQRSHYYNVKPDRNFLFDHEFLNPWPTNEKMETIALPPSLYGFSQQPIYSFGKDRYTSKLFHEYPETGEEISDRLIYKSKIVFFPEEEDHLQII